MVEETFKSFKEFRDFVNFDAPGEQIGLAFRGEPSASKDWTLEAKLFRLIGKNQSPIKARDELRESFNNILGNRPFKLQEEPSEDHKFAIMQHYGTSTQLLDWTESADIALFFAFNPVPVSADEEYVVVYIADIGKTHFAVYSADKDIDASETKPCQTKESLDSEVHNLFSNYWIFIRQPQFWDIRLSAQMGLFAWQGTKEPLDKFLSDSNAPSLSLLKCMIPVKDRKEVMKYLKEQGITSETIFPSWEKVCGEVESEFRNYLTAPGSALGYSTP